MKKVYWWAEPDTEKLLSRLTGFNKTWSASSTNPFVQAWHRNRNAYYSTVLEANHWESALGYVGEQGELIKMVLPTARSLVRQMVTLVTKQRLSFTAIAETKGTDVTKDIKIANAKIEEIIKVQHLDRKSALLAEHACVYGIGFMMVTWRTDKGTPYAANSVEGPNGEPLPKEEYDGDIDIWLPTVLDLTFDARIQDFSNLDWIQVRTLKNRHDMIAQFPHMEEELLAIPPVMRLEQAFAADIGDSETSEDLIFVYEAYHRPTPAVPEGRMVVFCDDRTPLFDNINPYGCLPIVCIKPEPVIETGYGYPILSNLLPAQEMFDTCLSAISTNNAALAVQSVLYPRGADIDVQSIGGMNWIPYTPQGPDGGGKPEPLQLTASAPETFKFADALDKYMTAVSGLNSTIRGQPPAGLTSGTAIATMSANALEFLNSLSQALDLGLEELMYKACDIVMKFAVVPRDLVMTGKNNKSSVVPFTGDSMRVIKRIKINRANPLMQTLAGRSDVADKLLDKGLIKDVQQYFSIIEGQPVQELYEDELSENDLIQSENEVLQQGGDVIALWTDDHPRHIRKHAMLLNDPVIRMNRQHIEKILAHIEEHDALAMQTDPRRLAMVRTGKIPEMAPPGGGPPPGGGAPIGEDMGPLETTSPVAEPAADQLARGGL